MRFIKIIQEIKKSILDQLLSYEKIISLLKNKYGTYVLNNVVKLMSLSEKILRKNYLYSKFCQESYRDKTRVFEFLEIFEL